MAGRPIPVKPQLPGKVNQNPTPPLPPKDFQGPARDPRNPGATGPYSGPAPTPTPTPAGPSEWELQLERYRSSAFDDMIAVLKSFGIDPDGTGLAATIRNWVYTDRSPDWIKIELRNTDAYKKRFPAMQTLISKGRAMSEAEYIAYERTAANLEQRFGLPEGMLMGNVTTLLENEVSASELSDRVELASVGAIMAPQEIKDEMRNRYGVDPNNALTAYYLDPDIALPLIEKQYASAVIGAEATRQGLGVDTPTVESLQALGISREQARQGFGEVAASAGLMYGKGDVVDQGELVGSAFGTDVNAALEVERVAKSRLAAFEGGGGFVTDKTGVGGLGVSST